MAKERIIRVYNIENSSGDQTLVAAISARQAIDFVYDLHFQAEKLTPKQVVEAVLGGAQILDATPRVEAPAPTVA